MTSSRPTEKPPDCKCCLGPAVKFYKAKWRFSNIRDPYSSPPQIVEFPNKDPNKVPLISEPCWCLRGVAFDVRMANLSYDEFGSAPDWFRV